MRTPTNKERRELFAAAYHEHSAELMLYAQKKIGDPELGKDLVQEAYLKTWMYMRSGKRIAHMKSFLYHVLKNLVIDRYRKQKTLSLDVLLSYGYEPSANDSDSFIDSLDGKAAIGLLDQLPPLYRNILRMRYEHNLSVGEIAQRSGKSSNSVAVCVHRGLAKLRTLSGSLASIGGPLAA